MKFESTPLAGSFIIHLDQFKDNRGWFSRTYSGKEFEGAGLRTEWVQMNHSFSDEKGTIRGMHYQLPPFTEIKVVRCISGKMYDVIVDIRKESRTFLQWFCVELSKEALNMLYIPEGFAHGFQTLTDDCEVLYMHSAYYTAGSEAGLKYNDEKLNIPWPLQVSRISDRDNNHPVITSSFKGI
jgi:dTDP-4-dehydrorhamnose 3,5-epimerase